MKEDLFVDYFETNAKAWMQGGYSNQGYNYPVAFHRVRVVKKILSNVLSKGDSILDIGCGGGYVSIELAKMGFQVTGIDRSQEMINLAEKEVIKSHLPERNVKFINASLESYGFPENHFDAIVVMGVIGYLSDESVVFQIAKKALKPGGILLVSCRNRLFNMISPSFRTKKEIESGNAVKLLEEIESLYQKIPDSKAQEMCLRFDEAKFSHECKGVEENPDEINHTPSIEAKQHTPSEISNMARKYAFSVQKYYGIHPHFALPAMNKLLPPGVYNKISNCLEVLEDFPISLAFSSVFIGQFLKQK